MQKLILEIWDSCRLERLVFMLDEKLLARLKQNSQNFKKGRASGFEKVNFFC
jgi:hypothetical protein